MAQFVVNKSSDRSNPFLILLDLSRSVQAVRKSSMFAGSGVNPVSTCLWESSLYSGGGPLQPHIRLFAPQPSEKEASVSVFTHHIFFLFTCFSFFCFASKTRPAARSLVQKSVMLHAVLKTHSNENHVLIVFSMFLWHISKMEDIKKLKTAFLNISFYYVVVNQQQRKQMQFESLFPSIWLKIVRYDSVHQFLKKPASNATKTC